MIPARRASTRLPEKLLLDESGRPLLAHTVACCLKSEQADRVVVATDDEDLAAIAEQEGAQAILTDSELASGSDRVWAAVEPRPEVARIANVQGDEPEIDPAAVDRLLQLLQEGAAVGTLAAPLPQAQISDPAAVKVVSDLQGRALYFSRAPIPYPRVNGGVSARLHVGLYAYRREALQSFAETPPSPLESTEGLEQLRFLEHGVPIQVLDWPQAFPGIDTRADYDAFLDRVRRQP
ncbi:MAG: 3-deoxy-manno-octulosonate cytidylyltransferase [Planctomycetota bacterium]|nr:MAG: 3-deoxy-manno-octulosonate cytidylyltransferase [Planctomycetota bacterium]